MLLPFQLSPSMLDYLPVFFQASLGASPIRSGVDMLPTSVVIAPFALIAGIMVQIMNKYRPANYIGWVVMIIGFGIMTLLRADSTTGQWVGYQILVGAGAGFLVSPLST